MRALKSFALICFYEFFHTIYSTRERYKKIQPTRSKFHDELKTVELKNLFSLFCGVLKHDGKWKNERIEGRNIKCDHKQFCRQFIKNFEVLRSSRKRIKLFRFKIFRIKNKLEYFKKQEIKNWILSKLKTVRILKVKMHILTNHEFI